MLGDKGRIDFPFWKYSVMRLRKSEWYFVWLLAYLFPGISNQCPPHLNRLTGNDDFTHLPSYI